MIWGIFLAVFVGPKPGQPDWCPITHPAAKPAKVAIQSGKSSWYGPGFEGKKTASGRIFHSSEMTCAHRTLPFGTRILVTSGSRSVEVVVTDRGPYVKGRILDLSHAAMERLAPGKGLIWVTLWR